MSLDEKMILLATCFLFLPYQIASVGIACILVQAFCRHKLVDAIKNQTGAIFFIWFYRVGIDCYDFIFKLEWFWQYMAICVDWILWSLLSKKHHKEHF